MKGHKYGYDIFQTCGNSELKSMSEPNYASTEQPGTR